VEETGRLIECGKKNAEEIVGEMESANIPDGPEQEER
jgi:hypothetical protein